MASRNRKSVCADKKAVLETIMATTYTNSLALDNASRASGGFIGRVFRRVIEARQKEANRRILFYLQGLDARALRTYGYTDGQIRDIRGGRLPLGMR
jgi:hypothetical protein